MMTDDPAIDYDLVGVDRTCLAMAVAAVRHLQSEYLPGTTLLQAFMG